MFKLYSWISRKIILSVKCYFRKKKDLSRNSQLSLSFDLSFFLSREIQVRKLDSRTVITVYLCRDVNAVSTSVRVFWLSLMGEMTFKLPLLILRMFDNSRIDNVGKTDSRFSGWPDWYSMLGVSQNYILSLLYVCVP